MCANTHLGFKRYMKARANERTQEILNTYNEELDEVRVSVSTRYVAVKVLDVVPAWNSHQHVTEFSINDYVPNVLWSVTHCLRRLGDA